SSSAAPGQPIGLTTMGARFVPGPLVPPTPRGYVKSIMLVSHCGPVTTQLVPLIKFVVRMPAICTIFVTGQVSTFVPYLPRLVTAKGGVSIRCGWELVSQKLADREPGPPPGLNRPESQN